MENLENFIGFRVGHIKSLPPSFKGLDLLMEKHVWRLHNIPPGYHLITIGMEIRNQENVGFFISDGTQHVRPCHILRFQVKVENRDFEYFANPHSLFKKKIHEPLQNPLLYPIRLPGRSMRKSSKHLPLCSSGSLVKNTWSSINY